MPLAPLSRPPPPDVGALLPPLSGRPPEGRVVGALLPPLSGRPPEVAPEVAAGRDPGETVPGPTLPTFGYILSSSAGVIKLTFIVLGVMSSRVNRILSGGFEPSSCAGQLLAGSKLVPVTIPPIGVAIPF